MLCVPYMQNILKIETKKAHATAVFVMFCLSLVSSFVYAFSQTYNFVDVAVVSVFASIGSLVGALCLKKFKSIVIEFIFLALLLFAAIKMVVWLRFVQFDVGGAGQHLRLVPQSVLFAHKPKHQNFAKSNYFRKQWFAAKFWFFGFVLPRNFARNSILFHKA